MHMRKLILLSILFLSLVSCGKKTEEAANQLTPEQEVQMVDSAATETKERIDSLGQSVDALQAEVDSLLNK
jgi:uncharacterized protein YcfL